MKRFYILGFLALIIFDTFAQISFKSASAYVLPLDFSLQWFGNALTIPWIYGAVLGYLGAFFTWMTLLKFAPIGASFAASHLELVTVTIFSVWFFHEPLNIYKILGGALIILGVLCLAKSEDCDAPAKIPQKL